MPNYETFLVSSPTYGCHLHADTRACTHELQRYEQNLISDLLGTVESALIPAGLSDEDSFCVRTVHFAHDFIIGKCAFLDDKLASVGLQTFELREQSCVF